MNHNRRKSETSTLKHNERLWSVVCALLFVILWCLKSEIFNSLWLK